MSPHQSGSHDRSFMCVRCVYKHHLCLVFRSKIRIRDGRAKPIDLLAKYISAEDDDLAVEMHEPYTFLNGLTVNDMDDLLEDIKVWLCATEKVLSCLRGTLIAPH